LLCSWARHSTLAVPLSTQVDKWVPANLMPAMDWHPIQGGVAIFLNWDKFQPDGPLRLVCRLYPG